MTFVVASFGFKVNKVLKCVSMNVVTKLFKTMFQCFYTERQRFQSFILRKKNFESWSIILFQMSYSKSTRSQT